MLLAPSGLRSERLLNVLRRTRWIPDKELITWRKTSRGPRSRNSVNKQMDP